MNRRERWQREKKHFSKKRHKARPRDTTGRWQRRAKVERRGYQ